MKGYRRSIIIMFLIAGQIPLMARQENESGQYLQDNGYTFVPQTMFPLGMPAVQLAFVYELKIGRDSISSYLPYAGRAFQVDYGTRTSVTDFITTRFKYSESSNSKGVYKIRIDLNDNREVRTINITIYSGNKDEATGDQADVVITFNQHQSITYRGKVIRNTVP